MSEKRVSDDALVEAYQRTGSQRAVIRETGLPRTTVRRRLKRLSEEGRFLGAVAMPGFAVTRVSDGPRGREVEQRPEKGDTFEVPAGHLVKGVSALLDPDGREIVKWVKTREDGGVDPFTLAGWLKDFFSGYVGPAPAPPPAETEADTLNLVPLADWHVGLHTWGREVGRSWDLKIAETTLGGAIDELFARTPAAASAVVLGGGDLTHTDDNTNATPASKHSLQADGRYPKIIETTCRLVLQVIARALERHQDVRVRLLPGNHDPHAHVAVAYFLSAYYRDEPRVHVDLDPALFWWHRFGSVYLAATHGHMLKAAAAREMPLLMAAHQPEMWGATRHRYAHTFHVHHTKQTIDEAGGVVTETHQAPVPADVFAYGSGYVSGRSLQSITYHAEKGEIGRARVAIA